MSDMRLEISADWLPRNPLAAGKHNQALLIALKDAFGITGEEACSAARRAMDAYPMDKIIVICTPAQFGKFIMSRCESGGRNLIQDLKARELRADQAEPGIGNHGTVFDVRPDAKYRIQWFVKPDAKLRDEWMLGGEGHTRLIGDQIDTVFVDEATHFPPTKCGTMSVDEYQRGPQNWVRKLFCGKSDAQKKILAVDFGKFESHVLAGFDGFIKRYGEVWTVVDESSSIKQPKWAPHMPEPATDDSYFYGKARHAVANWRESPLGQETSRALRAEEIKRLRTKADNSEKYALQQRHTDIRAKSLKRVKQLREKADALEAMDAGKPTWQSAYEKAKRLVHDLKLKWPHVKAVKNVFGVQHHLDLRPEDIACYMKALDAVVEARRLGLPEIIATKTELNTVRNKCVALEITNSNLVMDVRVLKANAAKHKVRADEAEDQLIRLGQELTTVKAERNRARETIRRLEELVNSGMVQPGARGHQLDAAYKAGAQFERLNIADSMERRAAEKYKGSESAFGSAATRLRAACYSLREHARQIREHII